MSHPASITVKACSAESATAALVPATIPPPGTNLFSQPEPLA